MPVIIACVLTFLCSFLAWMYDPGPIQFEIKFLFFATVAAGTLVSFGSLFVSVLTSDHEYEPRPMT